MLQYKHVFAIMKLPKISIVEIETVYLHCGNYCTIDP